MVNGSLWNSKMALWFREEAQPLEQGEESGDWLCCPGPRIPTSRGMGPKCCSTESSFFAPKIEHPCQGCICTENCIPFHSSTDTSTTQPITSAFCPFLYQHLSQKSTSFFFSSISHFRTAYINGHAQLGLLSCP